MAELETTVKISGIVLGSLMFQHFNSDCDAEGFILGENKAEERSDITDSQMDRIQFEHTINVQKHISCQRLLSFYDSAGAVKIDEIRRILAGHKEENVIGWYRQRRNTELQMTFREQVVHGNLKRALSNHELVFLLLTPTEVSPIGSTHRLEYSVFRSHGSQYVNIPIRVSNLGTLEQQSYWRFTSSCSSSGYNQAVKKHRSRFFASDGSLKEVSEVNDMNNTLLAELKAACKDVEKSERSLETLLADISALREAIAHKKLQAQFERAPPVTKAEPQENVLLCEAVRKLFPKSPLLRSTALDLGGSPLPAFSYCADHGIDIASALPLILCQRDARARRRRPGEGDRPWGEPRFSKKKRRKASETDSDELLGVSGSDTEDELLAPPNGGLKVSNSPVF